ncbi:molybdopterin-binding protein [Aquimarina sp. SS2-1]|uniref:TOBE domain-containing protein n=1 Tax=Aquimarina besae TaxID=3342247 RepID=UPI003671E089
MNIFSGNISNIKVSQSVSLVTIRLNEQVEFKTILVETPETASYLNLGNPVNVLFKETEVIISIEDRSMISVQNKTKGVIKEVIKGTLLSKVILKTSIGDIVSVITTEVLDELKLRQNQDVIVMVKTNEIMLSE